MNRIAEIFLMMLKMNLLKVNLDLILLRDLDQIRGNLSLDLLLGRSRIVQGPLQRKGPSQHRTPNPQQDLDRTLGSRRNLCLDLLQDQSQIVQDHPQSLGPSQQRTPNLQQDLDLLQDQSQIVQDHPQSLGPSQ